MTDGPEADEVYMTPRDAAAMLHTTLRTLAKMADDDESCVRAVKLRTKRKYLRQSILDERDRLGIPA